RYVWLPLEFGQDDEIILEWYDEWDLETLDKMFRVEINTKLTDKVTLGELPELPDVINVDAGNKTLDTPVNWLIDADDFMLPGIVEVSGELPELSNKVIRTNILVIPNNVKYFVNAGGTESSDYLTWSSYMKDTLINNDVMDQQYDPNNGQMWGYVGEGTSQSINESGDLFSALRYLKSGYGDDLTYHFELDSGDYNVYLGFYDPWFNSTGGTRKADVFINDTLKTQEYYFTNNYDVLGYEGIEITDGILDVTVSRSGSSPDPQISWIIISEEVVNDEPGEEDEGTDEPGEPNEEEEDTDEPGEPNEEDEGRDEPGEPNEEDEGTDESGEPDEEDENIDKPGEEGKFVLPSTATNMFNIVIAGSILLSLGFILLILRYRKFSK